MSNKVWPDEDEEQMDVDMKKWHWRGNPKDFVAEDDDSKLRWFFCLFLFSIYNFPFNNSFQIQRHSGLVFLVHKLKPKKKKTLMPIWKKVCYSFFFKKNY